MTNIHQISHLTLEMLHPLIEPSLAEGYNFVQKLWEEYDSGKVTFTGEGETLLGGYLDGKLIAVGGIHLDPYLNQPHIGRIRHVYVLPEYRRTGVGKRLVLALIHAASDTFTTVTLRTPTDHGRAFYNAIGFSEAPKYENATHWLDVLNYDMGRDSTE